MNSGSRSRGIVHIALFALCAAIVFGIVAFLTLGKAEGQVGFGWYLFAYAAGITMIVLPCTLPLAFVIVPLSMGKGPVKGLLIALSFGLGVAFTLSMYGVIAAIVGKVAIGSIGAPLEVVKNWLYFIAGILAYLFALGELGLVNFRMPSYTGAFPDFIQKQQDYLKALLLGLFLGNIGIGCPHPATPFILGRIAVSGDVFYGWLLFFVHAVGRVIPLLFLAVLGIMGVNALQALVKHKDKIERGTGWGMIFVAGFILVLGLFSHDWWVVSGIHTYLEDITQEGKFLNIVAQQIGGTVAHAHGLPPATSTGLLGLPLAWGSWVMLALWIVPLFWYYNRRKRTANTMSESPEKSAEERTLPYLFRYMMALALLLVMVFGFYLPGRFLVQAQMPNIGGHMMTDGSMMAGMNQGASGHAATAFHEEGNVTSGIAVNFTASPSPTIVGASTSLQYFVNIKPSGQGLPEAALAIQHEKKMHMIGVRSDLNGFFHIHPQPRSDNPALFEASYTFSLPGDYKMWSEVHYENMGHVFGHPLLRASGDGPTAEPRGPVTTSVIAGKYQVLFHYNPFGIGDNTVSFEIRDAQGQPAKLGNYLGEKMHVAVISEDLTEFIHAHPGTAAPAGAAGDGHTDHTHAFLDDLSQLADVGHNMSASDPNAVNFVFSLKRQGNYKVFAQFQPQDSGLSGDQYVLAEFWVNVSNIAVQTSGGATGLLLGWWPKLLVSLLLMAGLSWGIKKYISIEK